MSHPERSEGDMTDECIPRAAGTTGDGRGRPRAAVTLPGGPAISPQPVDRGDHRATRAWRFAGRKPSASAVGQLDESESAFTRDGSSLARTRRQGGPPKTIT